MAATRRCLLVAVAVLGGIPIAAVIMYGLVYAVALGVKARCGTCGGGSATAANSAA